MARPIKVETWDGTPAPTNPGGWAIDPGFQTSNSIALSGVNSLRYFNPGVQANCRWPIKDAYNGNVHVKASIRFSGDASGQVSWLLFCRATADALNGYFIQIEPPGSALAGVTLQRVNNGVGTFLASTVNFSDVAPNIWWNCELQVVGNTLRVFVQNNTTKAWLTGVNGIIGLSKVPCITVNDTGITGSGYAGLTAYQNPGETNPQYSDN